MYKIFFDNKEFIICDFHESRLTQMDSALTNINSPKEMSEIIAYFANVCKRNHMQVCVANLDEGFKWFSAYFTTIEAAGGLVKNNDCKYLLIYRLNHWDLPKGKCEKDETSMETALREVEEECSLKNINIQSHIIDTYHVYRREDLLYLKKTYWYAMQYTGNDLPIPQTEESIEKTKWVSINELYKYIPHMYKSIIEVFKAAKLIDSNKFV